MRRRLPPSGLLSLLCLTLSLGAGPLAAQVLTDCDRPAANARYVTLPVEDAVRTYAEGAITVISLDTYGEPACCSSYLMIVFPQSSEPFPQCRLLTVDGSLGYFATDLPRTAATYDAATGLTLEVPVETLDAETGQGVPASVRLTIDQAAGTVTLD